MKEGERGPFSPKLRVRIKDNNSSPHGKFYRFLLPFSSKFSDLNFASYVLYILESSGRFQSVLATDWSDGNTIKMITGRNRKRMAAGILFSVCRTCNRYIISNNHPLDLFGEKTIREGIVRD